MDVLAGRKQAPKSSHLETPAVGPKLTGRRREKTWRRMGLGKSESFLSGDGDTAAAASCFFSCFFFLALVVIVVVGVVARCSASHAPRAACSVSASPERGKSDWWKGGWWAHMVLQARRRLWSGAAGVGESMELEEDMAWLGCAAVCVCEGGGTV